MGALDLRHVEEPGGVPHQQPAGEREPRDRLDPAFADRARAVGDPPPALEHGTDLRMGLEALELLEGAQVGVGVVEADHEPDRDLVVFEVVEERAAVGRAVERPSERVHDQPLLVPGRIDLPQLLDADAVGLRVHAGAQAEALEQPLGQMAAAALGEDGHPRVQLDPRLEARLRLPVAPDAHVPGRHPLDRAVLAVEHLGGGKAGEDRHVERLCLLAEPAAQVPQADDVVAGVVHLGRGRQPYRAAPGQEEEPILPRGGMQRRPALLPVREQLVERARLQHRAGEDVGADLGPFLDDADGEVRSPLGAELPQPDGSGEPRRPRPDDDDVELHRLAFHVPTSLGARGRRTSRAFSSRRGKGARRIARRLAGN